MNTTRDTKSDKMDVELWDRVQATWANHFKLPPGIIHQPGTTLLPNDTRTRESWLTLWQVGQRIVIEIAPDWLPEIQQIVDSLPPDHRLTVDNFKDVWGVDRIEHDKMKMYVLETEKFRPFAPPPQYTIRQLTPADQPAFDVFLANCSADDQDEGDVSIDYDITFGVFDGERIVTASSVFEWRGFIDIGILTDPAYRKQGLGKAAVGRVCEHYLPHERIIGYRHDSINLGSQGIAEGLGFTYYTTIESVKLNV